MKVTLSISIFLLLIAPAALAQTGVCDSVPGNAYGLCNAYCEAMDCDNPAHAASDKACDRVFMNFVKKTGEAPPCNPCPCVDETNYPIFTDFEDGTTPIFSCNIEEDEAVDKFTVEVVGLSGDFAFAGSDATGGTVEAGCFATDPAGNEEFLDLSTMPLAALSCANLLIDAAEDAGLVCM